MGLYFRKCVTLRSSIFPLFFEAKKPSCYPSFLKKISLPQKNTGNHPGFRPFFLFPPFFEILCLSVILGCGGQPKREVSCGERKVGFAFGRGLTRTWVGEGSRKPHTRPKFRVLPKKRKETGKLLFSHWRDSKNLENLGADTVRVQFHFPPPK